ncbi:hypothetical protein [Paractinoplanes maris]|uniref:hypothetical protein n=1 Tax=Paractinoplanes maris TaxID=1734446 RepID=UPI0020213731|nr:hypothetical protein [Actinoplanes maris]
MNILDRIQRDLDGLCPCGAPPHDGSAYCSEDCVPNHRAEDTTSDTDGTQMRWRPDLVTEVDDSDLLNLGSVTWYDGRFNARLYQRGIPERPNHLVWHLRLDDGNRYVGLDLHNISDTLDADHESRMAHAWARLERELSDRRRLDPDPWAHAEDPWADIMRQYEEIIDDYVLGAARQAARAGESLTIQLDNSDGVFQPVDSAAVRWSLLNWFPTLPDTDARSIFRITST